MQYSRLVDSLIDECIAANLGGYDVADVLMPRATDGDLVREILVRAVCDPRFKSTVRVAKAWQDDARDLMEEFAQGLLDTRDLGREEALERLEAFLSRYFFTMVRRFLPADSDTRFLSGAAGEEDRAEGDGATDLARAFWEIDAGPEETRSQVPDGEGRREGGGSLSREEEQQAELRFLRSIPPSLRCLARLIGRSGAGGTPVTGRFLSASKSDIAGITAGDDLGSLLPSEVALLAERRTEDVFLRKFAGKRLQVFASASAGGKGPVRRQDGPVVVCLDRSSSMEGRPSEIARALTLAVAIVAGRMGREVAVVRYHDADIDCFTVRNLRRQRKELVRFLSYGCAGGNDEDAMFGTVFRDLLPPGREFSDADILCVSDFKWSAVGIGVMERLRECKARGMRVYGLDVTGEGLRGFRPASWMDPASGAHPSGIVDSMWLWDENGNRCIEEQKEAFHGKI
jgi:hypothetical protein